MDNQSALRAHLAEQLTGEHAHVGLDRAVEELELNDTGIIPESFAHSIWMLVEHIRIAQHDILDFSRNPDYQPLSWPDGYWPENPAPASQKAWENSLTAIKEDRDEMVQLIKDTGNNLLEPFPHGDGQTLFREAVLIVDHNSYHIGQIVQLRRVMGIW